MKKFSKVALGAIALAVGIGGASLMSMQIAQVNATDVDLTSTFLKGNETSAAVDTSTAIKDVISDNEIGITGFSDFSKTYYATSSGLKIGASSSAGKITFAFPATEVSGVVVNAKLYNSSKAVDLTITVGSDTVTKALTSSFADYTLPVSGSISTLTLSATKYCYVSSITLSAKKTYTGTVSSVTLSDLTALTVGEVKDIHSSATVAGTGVFDSSVAWTSSDPAVASIDATTGIVTAFKAGTSNITATSAADSAKSATKQITINAAPAFSTVATALSEFNSLNLADNGYSSHAYQVKGLIKTATSYSGSNGSLLLVDSLTDTNSLTVFGAFHDAISNMDYIKGGTITVLGYFEKYVKGTTTTPEIVGKDAFVLSAVSYDDEVLQFVSWMNGIGTGDATTGMTADHATCLANYKAAKTKVLAMSSDGVTKLGAHTDAAITNARTRYENWCKAIGDATPYSGEIINSANVAALNTAKDNVYLLYSLLGGSVLAAGAFFVFRKKKEA